MPQEENEQSWFDGFNMHMNTTFTHTDFRNYMDMVMDELPIIERHVPHGGRILDVGCGLGCEAVPLSALGYNVTGIDNDPKVVDAVQENARNFGKKINIIYGDIFNIDTRFGRDDFDACISGGVLEHFPKEMIREVVDKQLSVAPIMIASMPFAKHPDVHKEYKDYVRRICHDGMYRNLWTETYWIKDILKGYNILEHSIQKMHSSLGDFDLLYVVVGR
ncbi:MAG: class I SAM-dependent methyltransferase [Candidatus Woesearchaeota archaeon]